MVTALLPASRWSSTTNDDENIASPAISRGPAAQQA
jgi:hypothetical protein